MHRANESRLGFKGAVWGTTRKTTSPDLVDAPEMALWRRRKQDLRGLVHHSDRRVQSLSVGYAGRLALAGAVAAVGSRGDSYDRESPAAISSRSACRLAGAPLKLSATPRGWRRSPGRARPADA